MIRGISARWPTSAFSCSAEMVLRWRPAAIASYSLQQTGGARAAYNWHATLNEMGMVVVSSSITIGPITEALNEDGEPIGASGAYLEKKLPRFVDDLKWWMEAASAQRLRAAPPY